MTHPMPAEMEKVLFEGIDKIKKDYSGSDTLQNRISSYSKGFDACYEAMMKNARVVEIPEDCEECTFYEKGYFVGCNLYLKGIEEDKNDKPIMPDFCKAKSVTIILNER